MCTCAQVTSVVQHHDSITGTSKPEVTADLDVRLRASINASTRVLRNAAEGLLLQQQEVEADRSSSSSSSSSSSNSNTITTTNSSTNSSSASTSSASSSGGNGGRIALSNSVELPSGEALPVVGVGDKVFLFNGMVHDRVEPVTVVLVRRCVRTHRCGVCCCCCYYDCGCVCCCCSAACR